VSGRVVIPSEGCAQPALDAMFPRSPAAASACAAAGQSPLPALGPHPARGEGATVVFAFPPGYSPSAKHTLWECGANARHNRYVAARITRQIRADVVKLANSQRTPRFTGPVTILVVQHPPKGRRGLDSENVAPLGKAAIDGLRDARVLINDTSKWVPTVSYTTGERVERGQLVLHITPVGGAR